MKSLIKSVFFRLLDLLNFRHVESFFHSYLDQKCSVNTPLTELCSSNANILPRLYHQAIPDRYSYNLTVYQKTTNFLNFEDLTKWLRGNDQNNSRDLARFFLLNLCIDQLLDEDISGNVAELGVYKGNSAHLLAKYAKRINRDCYLFDTFEGFDKKDLVNRDKTIDPSLFKDTSLETVKSIVGSDNVQYVKGYFPDSLENIGDLAQFSLVHIDCDLGKPFRHALEYFYPRLVEGGFLILHDYSSLFWPGATQAINEFFMDKPEFVIPLPDKSGTCIVRKI